MFPILFSAWVSCFHITCRCSPSCSPGGFRVFISHVDVSHVVLGWVSCFHITCRYFPSCSLEWVSCFNITCRCFTSCFLGWVSCFHISCRCLPSCFRGGFRVFITYMYIYMFPILFFVQSKFRCFPSCCLGWVSCFHIVCKCSPYCFFVHSECRCFASCFLL